MQRADVTLSRLLSASVLDAQSSTHRCLPAASRGNAEFGRFPLGAVAGTLCGAEGTPGPCEWLCAPGQAQYGARGCGRRDGGHQPRPSARAGRACPGAVLLLVRRSGEEALANPTVLVPVCTVEIRLDFKEESCELIACQGRVDKAGCRRRGARPALPAQAATPGKPCLRSVEELGGGRAWGRGGSWAVGYLVFCQARCSCWKVTQLCGKSRMEGRGTGTKNIINT